MPFATSPGAFFAWFLEKISGMEHSQKLKGIFRHSNFFTLITSNVLRIEVTQSTSITNWGGGTTL